MNPGHMDAGRDPVRVLSSIACFAGLDLPILKSIADVTGLRTCAAGEIVLLQGEPCAGLYIVQEGRLKGYRLSPSGREQVIRFIGPGEVFNEIGVLGEGINLVTVQALEPSRVWIVQREALLDLMDAHPQLCRRLSQSLAKQVSHLVNLVEDLSLHTVECRLARLLLAQSEAETVHRQRWATQAEIASQLGTVPGVINRTLRNLADQKLIRIERHRIYILDRPGLEKIAMCAD